MVSINVCAVGCDAVIYFPVKTFIKLGFDGHSKDLGRMISKVVIITLFFSYIILFLIIKQYSGIEPSTYTNEAFVEDTYQKERTKIYGDF